MNDRAQRQDVAKPMSEQKVYVLRLGSSSNTKSFDEFEIPATPPVYNVL